MSRRCYSRSSTANGTSPVVYDEALNNQVGDPQEIGWIVEQFLQQITDEAARSR
jgi:hypothetical protein